MNKVMARAVWGVAVGALVVPGALAANASAVTTTSTHQAASMTVTFGAKLSPSSQPSNAFDGLSCKSITGKSGPCTRVEVAALKRNDDAPAPANGTLTAVKLVAGVPGSFRLELARAKPESDQAKIVTKGPVISYQGQGTGQADEGPPYKVETFKTNMPIKKGDYLAIVASTNSLMYCSGGGLDQLVFQPVLPVGGSFATTKHVDGCILLLEGVEKT